MSIDNDARPALALVASLIKRLKKNNDLDDDDVAIIFAHADNWLPAKQNPGIADAWERAQEIIAGNP